MIKIGKSEETISKGIYRREGLKKMVIDFHTYRLFALPADIPELSFETASYKDNFYEWALARNKK